MTKENPAPLTDLQRKIMEIVWENSEVTVSQVREALSDQHELARNTVQTIMVRLEEKGWLNHREEGRTFLYSANVPRTRSLGQKVTQLIDQFFAGSPEEMVTALMEYRGLSKQEAEKIRDMLDKAEAKQHSQKRGK